ncbi:EamA/RhaT family transporter, partial [Vibrio furnissii]
MLVKMIPFLFVVLWASGFVGARFGLAYAEPMTFLTLRMVFNVLLFAGLIAVLKRRVPTGKSFWHS